MLIRTFNRTIAAAACSHARPTFMYLNRTTTKPTEAIIAIIVVAINGNVTTSIDVRTSLIIANSIAIGVRVRLAVYLK